MAIIILHQYGIPRKFPLSQILVIRIVQILVEEVVTCQIPLLLILWILKYGILLTPMKSLVLMGGWLSPMEIRCGG